MPMRRTSIVATAAKAVTRVWSMLVVDVIRFLRCPKVMPVSTTGRGISARDGRAPATSRRRSDEPRAAEVPHRLDDRQQRGALLRQLVLHARRRFRIAVPRHD